jgi:hypothetical protein
MQLDVFIIRIAFVSLSCELFVLWISLMLLLQLLETAWCLTNIAAGQPEETKALLPALPLLIAHLGGSFHLSIA